MAQELEVELATRPTVPAPPRPTVPPLALQKPKPQILPVESHKSPTKAIDDDVPERDHSSHRVPKPRKKVCAHLLTFWKKRPCANCMGADGGCWSYGEYCQ